MKSIFTLENSITSVFLNIKADKKKQIILSLYKKDLKNFFILKIKKKRNIRGFFSLKIEFFWFFITYNFFRRLLNK